MLAKDVYKATEMYWTEMSFSPNVCFCTT